MSDDDKPRSSGESVQGSIGDLLFYLFTTLTSLLLGGVDSDSEKETI